MNKGKRHCNLCGKLFKKNDLKFIRGRSKGFVCRDCKEDLDNYKLKYKQNTRCLPEHFMEEIYAYS